MTTITYKAGIIAYDSRMVDTNGTITDDDCDKCIIRDDVRYFYSGLVSQMEALICAYQKSESQEKSNGTAIIVDNGELFVSGIHSEDGFWKQPLKKSNPRAIGSGSDHALTAMDMGATAKEAVKWAMKRDTGTGGRIRTYKLR